MESDHETIIIAELVTKLQENPYTQLSVLLDNITTTGHNCSAVNNTQIFFFLKYFFNLFYMNITKLLQKDILTIIQSVFCANVDFEWLESL